MMRLTICLWAVLLSFPWVGRAGNLSRIEFPELEVSAAVGEESVRVFFNPKEYTITKSTPWKHHDIQGLDAPTLEFTSGEPYRCQFELFFDRYEEGKSVREITDKIERLAIPDQKTGQRPSVIVRWGQRIWETELLEAKTEVVDFSADNVPQAAIITVTWSSFELVAEDSAAEVTWIPLWVEGEGLRLPVLLNDQSIELLRFVDGGRFITSQSIKADFGRGPIPVPSFGEMDPIRLRFELVFDTTQSKEDVRQLVKQMESLAKVDPEKKQPPTALLTWGSGFRATLENFSVRYTLFLDDGTPVRAVMNTVWKEFSPAEDQLKGNPRH